MADNQLKFLVTPVQEEKESGNVEQMQEQLEALKKEFAFLSQQNSSMFTAMMATMKQSTETITKLVKDNAKKSEIDYDLLAEKIVEKLGGEKNIQLQIDTDDLSAKLADKMQMPELEIDFDDLAKDVARNLVVPDLEIDYRSLAQDIANKIYLPEKERMEEQLDYAKIAEYILDALPEVDYGAMAERLAGELNSDGEEVQNYIAEHQPAAMAEADEEPVEELVTIEEDPVAETAVEEEVAVAETSDTTVRLKRSYECKLRQASDDLKYYYGSLKNELLSYGKVKSNVSWSGDRYNFGRVTVAKMNIIGKTLCLYLALNPDDYVLTKYHQKFVGDVKAYQSTPMMVKVKSHMGLKRANTLIADMMNIFGANRQEIEKIDYIAAYEYKTDEEMLAAGEIKKTVSKSNNALAKLNER